MTLGGMKYAKPQSVRPTADGGFLVIGQDPDRLQNPLFAGRVDAGAPPFLARIYRPRGLVLPPRSGPIAHRRYPAGCRDLDAAQQHRIYAVVWPRRA